MDFCKIMEKKTRLFGGVLTLEYAPAEVKQGKHPVIRKFSDGSTVTNDSKTKVMNKMSCLMG